MVLAKSKVQRDSGYWLDERMNEVELPACPVCKSCCELDRQFHILCMHPDRPGDCISISAMCCADCFADLQQKEAIAPIVGGGLAIFAALVTFVVRYPKSIFSAQFSAFEATALVGGCSIGLVLLLVGMYRSIRLGAVELRHRDLKMFVGRCAKEHLGTFAASKRLRASKANQAKVVISYRENKFDDAV